MAEERFLTETKHQRFRPYPEYKDSGMKLIGSIPIGWHIKPIFALYERRTQRKHEDLRLLSVYRDYGVILREDREDNFNRPSLDLSPYQLVENRDLVLNKMKTWQGSIAVSELRGIVSPAYIICRPRHGEHDRYMHYLLRAPSYITQYASLSYGVRVDQWDLRFEDFRRIQVLLPPVEDQRAIAAFLDCETGKIDALIAKKERLIELLQEKRTALITQAVTKGLDPNVPMKDSGIEWLGKIPAHWEVTTLKRIGDLQAGAGFPDEEQGLDSEDIPFFKVGDMGLAANKKEMIDCPNTISQSTARRLRAYIFPPKTIVFAKVGAALLLNRRRVLSKPSCIDNNMMGFIPAYCDSGWALYWLCGLDLGELANPGAVPSVNEGQMRDTPVVVPLLNEQCLIAAFLDRETAKIDSLVSKVKGAIEHLKEYRTALISAAVAGKIDVRGRA